MKLYVRIYKRLLQLNFATLVAYRANFIASVISSTVWATFTLVSVLLLTSRSRGIYDWSREEIILMAIIYSIGIGIFHTVFSNNFSRFAHLVHTGELDTLLLKPIDSQFLVSFSLFSYTSSLRILLGLVLIVYLLPQMHISISLIHITAFSLLIIVGVLLLYSIWYIVNTLTIWYPHLSNIVELMFSVTSMGRYPAEMYRKFTGFIFFFILPITLVITSPTKLILQKLTLTDLVFFFSVTAVLFLISRKFWQFALKYYTSASG